MKTIYNLCTYHKDMIDITSRGTASQATPYNDELYPASNALTPKGNFTHTAEIDGAWWRLQFDKPYIIGHVIIKWREGYTQRSDNCDLILRLDKKIAAIMHVETAGDDLKWEAGNVVADEFLVKLREKNYLSITRVKVWGDEVPQQYEDSESMLIDMRRYGAVSQSSTHPESNTGASAALTTKGSLTLEQPSWWKIAFGKEVYIHNITYEICGNPIFHQQPYEIWYFSGGREHQYLCKHEETYTNFTLGVMASHIIFRHGEQIGIKNFNVTGSPGASNCLQHRNNPIWYYVLNDKMREAFGLPPPYSLNRADDLFILFEQIKQVFDNINPDVPKEFTYAGTTIATYELHDFKETRLITIGKIALFYALRDGAYNLSALTYTDGDLIYKVIAVMDTLEYNVAHISFPLYVLEQNFLKLAEPSAQQRKFIDRLRR